MNCDVHPSDVDAEHEPIFAGVDVGGTNIKVGLISDSGEVLRQSQFTTLQQRGPADAMKRAGNEIWNLAKECALEQNRIVSIGLGTPGPLDVSTGYILNPSNLPAWSNFAIRSCLQELVHRHVSFCNDANAAAMGEFWIGGGKQFDSLVLLTLGTGVGGGIVINDFLIEGAHSLGGECGHVTIDFSPSARICGCGQTGHLEAYTSATALVDRYCERAGIRTVEERPSAKQIAELAADDALAKAIVFETADFLSRGIAMLAHVVDPQAIILGGAMNFGGPNSSLGKEFLQRVRQAVAGQTFDVIGRQIQIEFASLGGAAGWIGAAAIARKQHHDSQAIINH